MHDIVYNVDMANNAFIDLLSLKEASNIWNVDESVLRRHILNNKFKVNEDVKKFGKQWVITKQAMEREYGIINSSNDEIYYSDNKKRDLYFYISECILGYAKRYKLDTIAVSNLFNKYNLSLILAGQYFNQISDELKIKAKLIKYEDFCQFINTQKNNDKSTKNLSPKKEEEGKIGVYILT